MKKMYRFLLFGLLFIAATSCNKDLDNIGVIEAERRIEGKWTMSTVKNKVRGDGKWGKNDLSGNFRKWEFDFLADKTMTLYIPDEDLNLVGTWEIYEDWETDTDGESDLVTFLYMYLYDPTNPEEWRQLVWEDMRVGRDEFKAREETFVNGRKVFYHYELKR